MCNGGRLCLVTIVLLAALAVPVASPPPQSAQSPSGPLSRRAAHDRGPYRIEVPSAWDGELAVLAHGYEGEGSGPGSVRTSALNA